MNLADYQTDFIERWGEMGRDGAEVGYRAFGSFGTRFAVFGPAPVVR